MMLRTTQIINIPTPKKIKIRVEMSKGLDGAALNLKVLQNFTENFVSVNFLKSTSKFHYQLNI